MVAPGATGGGAPCLPHVGMVGAGQLARMTYQAAIPLGLTLRLLAEQPSDSAARVGAAVLLGSGRSAGDLARFAAACDVVTFDHELVDADAVAELEAEGHRFRPTAATLRLAQNKRRQRAELGALGFPVPPHRDVSTLPEVAAFAEAHGWPVVLKAAQGGYDGRGVWVAEDETAAGAVLAEAARRGLALLVEAYVKIERELAVLVARRPGGECVDYPPVETVQVGGICRELLAPAPIPDELAEAAQGLARDIAAAAGASGILAVELFLSGGRLLVNELAARPHNSGHYSIDGCRTSQFENHLRAVLDWPLGDPGLLAPAVVTVNVLGDPSGADPQDHLPAALAMPDAHIHLYGKGARPGRKLGHVTVLGDDPAITRRRARRAASLLASGRHDGAGW